MPPKPPAPKPPAPTKVVVLNTTSNQTTNIDSNTKVDICVDVNIEAKSDVKGNIATATWDVSALGDNTFTNSDVTVTVIAGSLSESAGSAQASANDDHRYG